MQSIFKRAFTSCLCCIVFSFAAQAQEKQFVPCGWYIGSQGGLSMAESNFSSFGTGGFLPGWNAGLHGGYQLNHLWSVEVTIHYGQLFLTEQDCCQERNYILGEDHKRYRYSVPSGIDTYYYKDLKSYTFVQYYGTQMNLNILGFFARTQESRWRLELSPTVSVIGTSSDLMLKAEGISAMKDINKWHLGVGGNTQLSYALTSDINLALYGGFTHLMGSSLDGIPALHSTNYIIDAGLKFSIALDQRR